MGVYDVKPEKFLERLHTEEKNNLGLNIYCAGFELQVWRCTQFANHLIEWLPEYALPEEELNVSHGNMYVKLQQAAARVYNTKKYERRGEAGEIALHAICREYFDTIPISPRVFYKSTSNDVIKSFDMVHARFTEKDAIELWLGESKLYADSGSAIADAISSVDLHLEQGFLRNQKLLLGPQIPKSTPHYQKIYDLFKTQTSIDKFLAAAVFVVGIFCTSKSAKNAKQANSAYLLDIKNELNFLAEKISGAKLAEQIRIVLVYVPLGHKEALVDDFNRKLKGLQ